MEAESAVVPSPAANRCVPSWHGVRLTPLPPGRRSSWRASCVVSRSASVRIRSAALCFVAPSTRRSARPREAARGDDPLLVLGEVHRALLATEVDWAAVDLAVRARVLQLEDHAAHRAVRALA